MSYATAKASLAAFIGRHRIVLGLTLSLGLAAGAAYSGVRLRAFVEKRYATPTEIPLVQLKTRPAWMNDYLADRIEKTARPGRPASAFDRQLLLDVRDQLISDPEVAPWIEKINSIRRVYAGAPGDTVELDISFRAPAALVRAGDEFWEVDSSGIKLPEKFTSDQVPKVVRAADGSLVLRVIEGVTSESPDAGRQWMGDDLAAGLSLVRLLNGRAFADELVKVDVSNFGGRVDQNMAQLVLITRYNTEVRWGQPVTATGFEVSAMQKMTTLEKIITSFGRVDAGKSWIDIRFDKVLYPKASAEPRTGAEPRMGTDAPSVSAINR